MKNEIMQKIEDRYLRKDIPEFRVGDTVKVSQKITESGKTRLQNFEGIVIARKGSGIQTSFTLRRISFGEGVEKTFPAHSPTVQNISVTRKGKVRKSKLYYLRKAVGKGGRIEEAEIQESNEAKPAA